jgi:histidine triad (HIT) family protein
LEGKKLLLAGSLCYGIAMNNCIFCKIIRGEIPATKVYEDERTLALLDIQPVHPGHTLVVSKNTGTRNIFDISSKDWMAVSETVRRLVHAIEKATNCDGINILMNNRAYAGQIIDHPHVHVIPRFKGDGLEHWRKIAYKNGELQTVQERIRVALKT